MSLPTVPILTRPSGAERPVVVSVPHAGTLIPDEERGFYAIDVDQLLHDGDLYTDELYEGSAEAGATVVYSPYSRFVVDLNRLPDDFSPRSVAGERIRRAQGYYGHRGIIWAVTTHNQTIYRQPLDKEHVERRLARYYHPYHDTLRRELQRLRTKFGYAVLLDAHSMPSRATSLHADPGARRADIVPGDLDGRGCGAWLMQTICDFWTDHGYTVAPNTPYRGGGITRRFGRPKEGIHAIQIELNRALYMDETTLDRAAEFATIRRECVAMVQAVAACTPTR